jgi:hypothetical protein
MESTMRVRLLSASLATALTVLIGAAGCDGPTAPPGSEPAVRLAVQATTVGSAMVSVIAIEVTGPGIPVPILVNLHVVDGHAAGHVSVSPGQDRSFTARAFDSGANMTHDGVVVTDVRPGQGTVRILLYPRGVGVPIVVTLGAWSVSIEPGTASLEVGSSWQFMAAVRDADGVIVVDPELAWGSSNPAFAMVDNTGLVSGVHPGTARIVVSYDGVAAEALLTVTAAVDTPAAVITSPVGGAGFEQGAEIVFSGSATDGTGSPLGGAALVWTSGIGGVVGTGTTFVRNDLSVGTHAITLTATDAGGREGRATAVIHITVAADPPVLTSIIVLPALATAGGRTTEQFTATAYDQYGGELSGVGFTWSSSSPCIASVNATGLATTLHAPGNATIRASVGSVSGSARYSVTQSSGPAPASVAGDWLVCFRDTGAYHSTLHLIHEPGSEGVTGSLTLATGLVRSLTGTWRNNALTVVWSQPVRLSEATYFINSAVARSLTLLQGEHVDSVTHLNRDVDIVRPVIAP